MEDGWKELDISNLPSDIAVGDYEFEWSDKREGEPFWNEEVGGLTGALKDYTEYKYRYRLRPKKETLEEASERQASDWAETKFKDTYFCEASSVFVEAFKAGAKWQKEQE